MLSTLVACWLCLADPFAGSAPTLSVLPGEVPADVSESPEPTKPPE